MDLVHKYMSMGLKRDCCLTIVGLSKNQLYYVSNGKKPGKRATELTFYRNPKTLEQQEISEPNMVLEIVKYKMNPDHANWYRLITKSLQLNGYYINHKKVYRIMLKYLMLEDKIVTSNKNYVQFRRVAPEAPLQIIEMDIKYVWINEARKYAFILTIIDTFTRYVLDWSVGYAMKTEQVKQCWEYIIATYYQSIDKINRPIQVEVRSDNGKQFSSQVIIDFFKENQMNKVFTHPYTPEENAHVESFNKTLGNAIKNDTFNTLNDLENRLVAFFTCYNNQRSHSGTKGIPPSIFWTLFELKKIDVLPLPKHRLKYVVKVKYQDILTIKDIDRHDYRAKSNSE